MIRCNNCKASYYIDTMQQPDDYHYTDSNYCYYCGEELR